MAAPVSLKRTALIFASTFQSNTQNRLACLRLRLPAADSFDYKKFFKACGLASKTADDVKKAFAIIDQDNSGFIEEEELK